MNWIKVEDGLPEDGEYVLCWVCKFGELKNSESSYYIKLYYSTERKVWIDEYKGKEYNFENNPDYMYVTDWCVVEEPKS